MQHSWQAATRDARHTCSDFLRMCFSTRAILAAMPAGPLRITPVVLSVSMVLGACKGEGGRGRGEVKVFAVRNNEIAP